MQTGTDTLENSMEVPQKIKKIGKKQVLVRMWRKGNPLTLLVGMQAGAATLENSMAVPQKVENMTHQLHYWVFTPRL